MKRKIITKTISFLDLPSTLPLNAVRRMAGIKRQVSLGQQIINRQRQNVWIAQDGKVSYSTAFNEKRLVDKDFYMKY